MAEQHGLVKFTGKLGDKVGFRGKNGGFFVRTFTPVPLDVWRNAPSYEPSRVTAHNFGNDSSFATYIRHSLGDYLTLMSDKRLHNRLMHQIGEARRFCMRQNPKAPLDVRKIAPAFKHFSLRKDVTLKEVAQIYPTWSEGEDNVRTLHLPKLQRYGRLWKKVNVEFIRWHLVFVPLPVADADISSLNIEKIQTDWTPVNAIQALDIPIVFPNPTEGHPPILVALGLEAAQGNGVNFFPLRTICAMEILEII